MLTLKIITPSATPEEIYCDSITITVADTQNSKGGGLYGIRTGHADAIFATAKGQITAKTDGNAVFSELYSEGFATCRNNTVTVITEKINT